MNEFLSEQIAQLAEGLVRLDSLSEGLTDEHANQRPSVESWSVVECLEHLTASLDSYLPLMERAVEKARTKNRTSENPSLGGTMIGRMLINVLHPDSKPRRVRAPSVFKPKRTNAELAESVQRFRDATEALIELANKADGLDLGRVRFGTPVSFLVRVSLAQAFQIHAIHNLRHLDQAMRAREAVQEAAAAEA